MSITASPLFPRRLELSDGEPDNNLTIRSRDAALDQQSQDCEMNGQIPNAANVFKVDSKKISKVQDTPATRTVKEIEAEGWTANEVTNLTPGMMHEIRIPHKQSDSSSLANFETGSEPHKESNRLSSSYDTTAEDTDNVGSFAWLNFHAEFKAHVKISACAYFRTTIRTFFTSNSCNIVIASDSVVHYRFSWVWDKCWATITVLNHLKTAKRFSALNTTCCKYESNESLVIMPVKSMLIVWQHPCSAFWHSKNHVSRFLCLPFVVSNVQLSLQSSITWTVLWARLQNGMYGSHISSPVSAPACQ